MQGLDNITALSGESSAYDTGTGTDKAKEIAVQSIFNILGQLVNQTVRATANYSDEYKRDLGEYGSPEYYVNSFKNQIPILRQTLNVKTDNEGNPILNDQGVSKWERFLRDYILPYNQTSPKYSDLTKEAMRLRENISPEEKKTIETFVPSLSKANVTEIKGYDKRITHMTIYTDLENWQSL